MNPSVQKENQYIALINECHNVVDRISLKTELYQESNAETSKEIPTPARTALERELLSLLSHLTRLNESII